MSNIKERAGRIRQLKNDETFKDVIQEIRGIQTKVFLNAHSLIGEIEQAHDIIRALNEIENHFDSVLAEEAVFDKQQGDKETVPWRTRLKLD